MYIIPAIDIKDGQVVRLFQGDFDQVTRYNDDPHEIAARFKDQGMKFIHIIDLDGAKAKEPVNDETILDIASQMDVPVQVGGGIRSYEAAQKYLSQGVDRVLLSTAAVKDPELVQRLVADFGAESIVVAADIKNGEFATEGWTESGNKSVDQTIDYLKQLGICNVLVTDVSKDGTLQGPNYALTQEFINAGFQTICAGGVSTAENCHELNKRGAYGAVVGTAYYEGKIDIPQVQKEVEFKNNLVQRIIPCLDIKNGRVVKGTHFKDLNNIGDPIELAEKYSKGGADEIVFLDITATVENRKTLKTLVEKIAHVLDIPFCVGGGISTLEQIRELLAAGADKVSLGSAAVLNPEFVQKAVEYFGSQCIVISVDAKQKTDVIDSSLMPRWEIYIKGGREASGNDAVEFCTMMEKIGVGELLVNSLDRDGTNEGFDIELLKAVTNAVNVPVIASSGGGSLEAFQEVFEKTDVDAALGASLFHYKNIIPNELKEYLSAEGIPVRL